MARTAKKSLLSKDLPAEENLTLPGVTIEDAQQVPVVKESHRVVRTWEQARPMDELDDEFEDQEEIEEPPTPPAPNDPIEMAAREIAGSQSSWGLQVNRLPTYDRDQNTGPKARRFVGTLSIPDADYLREGLYLEEIQSKFARGINGNWFLLCVRRDNRNHSYLPPVCIEPPLPEVQAARAAENPAAPSVNVYPPPLQPQDGFKQFVQQAKQFAELRDLLFPQSMIEQMQPRAAVAEVPQPSKAAQLIDLVADDEVLESVTGKLKRALRSGGGNSEPERGWMDILYMAIERDTLPKLIHQFTSQFQGVNNGQRQMGAPPQAASTHPSVLGDANQTPSFDAQPPIAERPNLPNHADDPQAPPPELILLNQVIQHCSLQAAPAASAAWINRFADQHRSVEPAIDMFLTMTPEQAQSFLLANFPEAAPIINAEHTRGWIAELQAALQQEGDDDGE